MTKLLILLITTTVLFAREPISPLPIDPDYDKAKALLGKELFFDTILSKDYTIACISCHDVYNGGADTNKVSTGIEGKKGNIHSPTVLNARYNFKQFWNGRANNLHEQADGPINNPVEHAMDPDLVIERINQSTKYQELFKKVYNAKHVKYSQVLDAIVEFEKALVTPNAKFDKYLRGELDLAPDEKEGYVIFKQYGCITCHNGMNIGGNSFQKIGLFQEYRTGPSYPDRSTITNNPVHKNVFKVPTLRNVALTAPYFHDASAPTLEDAIKTMSFHNLGVDFNEDEIQKIIAFLKTLTGETPKILMEQE